MTTQYLIRKVETRQDCHGRGFVEFAHCRECGRPLSEEEMIALDNKDDLPCGHRITHLQEESWCVECEGEGQIETWIDLRQALSEIEDQAK